MDTNNKNNNNNNNNNEHGVNFFFFERKVTSEKTMIHSRKSDSFDFFQTTKRERSIRN